LNAITLFVGGLVAAGVAGQIRKHVQAALREAETKRALDAMQHDLQIARSIQQSLLPQEPPQIAGFEIAGWNRPADDTGGDGLGRKRQETVGVAWRCAAQELLQIGEAILIGIAIRAIEIALC
jgi:hypothetical protein